MDAKSGQPPSQIPPRKPTPGNIPQQPQARRPVPAKGVPRPIAKKQQVTKKRGPLFDLSKLTIVYLAISLGIIILSIFIIIIGVKGLGVKSNLKNALFYYDSNRQERTSSELLDALSWDERNISAREFLAKIKADTGDLIGAENEYKMIIEKFHQKSAITNYGLGVVYLKMAFTDEKNKQAYLDKARQNFKEAITLNKDLLEGHIGLGHYYLYQAHLTKEQTHLQEARKNFEEAETLLRRQEIARLITPDALYDFYSGYAKTLSMLSTELDKASSYYKAAYQLRPSSMNSYANHFITEAKRILMITDLEDLKQQKDNIISYIEKMRNKFRAQYQDQYPEVADSIVSLSSAYAYKFAQAGDYDASKSRLLDYYSANKDNFNYLLIRCSVISLFFDTTYKHDINTITRESFFPFQSLLQHPQINNTENTIIKAIAHNNLGAYLEYAKHYDQARENLELSLSLSPKMYEANRNYAVLLKKMSKDPKYQAKSAEFLELSRKHLELAQQNLQDQSLQADFEAVKKFVEVN